MSNRFDLYCNGCGYWHTVAGNPACVCAECGTSEYLSETAPPTSGDGLAAFHGPDMDAPMGAAAAVAS